MPDDYAVWLGEIKPLSHFKVSSLFLVLFLLVCSMHIKPFLFLQETYMVDMVCYVDEIIQVLSEQFKGSGKPLLYLLHGLNTDSGNLSKPASFEVSAISSFLLHLIIKILLIYWQAMLW